MKLTRIRDSIDLVECRNFQPVEIAGMSYDSRRVREGDAFFAISGTQDDGHRYAIDAVRRGAKALFLERPLDTPLPVPQVIVRNTRLCLAHASRAFFGDPASGMKVTAITGTNGKSSVAFLSQAILRHAGHPTGLISTVKVDLLTREEPAVQTTPESTEIYRHFREMNQAGAGHAVLEASSHALDQGRLAGIRFETAVFTNLSPEHLDYHPDMAHYLASKAKLFEMLSNDSFAIVNGDDAASDRMVKNCSAQCITYGLEKPADVMARAIRSGPGGSSFELVTPSGTERLHSTLVGRYNIYNVLTAAANALALQIRPDDICGAIEHFPGVPGRLQRIEAGQPFRVLVDYAHTPDALENVLKALQPLKGDCRLIVLFGCGGDRDRSKRSVMGILAETLADEVWVTSDNPRTEDPQRILDEILEKMTRAKPTQVEEDRRKAIHGALGSARPGDIVLLAGKGHEDYQILGPEKIHFDDAEVAAEFLGRRSYD